MSLTKGSGPFGERPAGTFNFNPAGAFTEAREAGHSWTVIGAALGTSKQAAHERFRAFVDR